MTRFYRLALSISAALLLTSCAANQPGALPSFEEEKELGAERTPDFLKKNGGLYRVRSVVSYVEEVTEKLTPHAGIPEEFRPLKVKVLNTSVPNAYAVPGGTIYVTTGMIALTNTEAQLAGVIAHEIGHVVARHSAQAIAKRELVVRDILRESNDALRNAGSRSRAMDVIRKAVDERAGDITTFSREQEVEADRLGIQIMAKAGYPTAEFATLLRSLNAWQNLLSKRLGMDEAEVAKLTEQSSYPKIGERVAALGPTVSAALDEVAQERLMGVIDGLRYDDRYDGGFVRDGTFWHRSRNVAFDLPPNFVVAHGDETILLSTKGAILVRRDVSKGTSLEDVMKRINRGRIDFSTPRRLEINGLPAATATARSKRGDSELIVEIVVFEVDERFETLIMFSEEENVEIMRTAFEQAKGSFREVSRSDVPSPRRFKTRRVAPGENMASLIAESVYDAYKETEFRVLNGLETGDVIQSGEWVKLVK